MLTPLESGFFDAIAGLPMHPLVVHFAVVLLPLAALGLVVLVAVPKWADRFGWLTLATLVVGTGAAYVAKESGEALAREVGNPRDHQSWGDLLPVLAVGLVLMAGIWYFLHRKAGGAGKPRSLAATVAGVIASVLALIVTGVTVVVGHSGAEAAWGGTLGGTNDQPTVAASTAPASGKPSATTKAPSALTMAEVAKHADATSCYSVVNKNVYDLTKWIGQHPGGAKRILNMCGQDGTAAFEGQHGGQNRAEQILNQYLIGPLG